jgi:hypothetical protein
MLIDRQGDDFRSSVTEGSCRSKVSRVFHPHSLARLDKEASEQIKPLLHTRDDHYLVRGTIHSTRRTEISGYGFA